MFKAIISGAVGVIIAIIMAIAVAPPVKQVLCKLSVEKSLLHYMLVVAF